MMDRARKSRYFCNRSNELDSEQNSFSGAFSITDNYMQGDNAGDGYTISTVIGNYASSLGYGFNVATINGTVGKRTLTVNLADQTLTYGDVLQNAAFISDDANGIATYNNLFQESDADNLTLGISYSGDLNPGDVPDAGADPTLSVKGLGDSAGNYQIDLGGGDPSADYTINPLGITITVDPDTNTYGDAANASTFSLDTEDFSGQLVNSDTINSVTGDTENFTLSSVVSTSDAGTYTDEIGIDTSAFNGVDASNYSYTVNQGTLIVAPATLTVTANDASKLITETDNPAYGGVTFSGFENGDDSTSLGGALTIMRIGEGVDEAAATYNDVLVPSNLASSNYTFNYVNGDYTIVPAQTLLLDIQSNVLTYSDSITYTVNSAKYLAADDTTIVTIASPDVTGSQVFVDDGLGTTATIEIAPENAVFSTSNNLVAGIYDLEIVSSTKTGSNFLESHVDGDIQINQKTLTPNVTGIEKIYDNTTTIPSLALDIPGIIGSDDVTISGTGNFVSPNAGTNLNYDISGLALDGDDSGNYQLLGTVFNGNDGVITPKEITLSGGKEFDGTTALDASDVTLGGFIGAETLFFTGATANSENVGSGDFISAITLLDGNNGGLASNYQLPTLNAINAPLTITQKPITLELNDQSFTYGFGGTPADLDGTAFNLVGGLAGGDAIGSLSLATNASLSTGGFYNAGTWDITSTGTNFTSGLTSNYAITYNNSPAELDITELDISPISIEAADKIFDGNTDASIASVDFDNILAGDVLALQNVNASFATPDIGTDIAVTVTLNSANLGGPDAGNYNFIFASLAGLADILPISPVAETSTQNIAATVLQKTQNPFAANPFQQQKNAGSLLEQLSAALSSIENSSQQVPLKAFYQSNRPVAKVYGIHTGIGM